MSITDKNKNRPDSNTKGKVLKGVVVSDKMLDTAVVEVARFVKHPKYKKYIKKNKRFKAHNPENNFKIGDKVVIEETRPISKDKHFKIVSKQ